MSHTLATFSSLAGDIAKHVETRLQSKDKAGHFEWEMKSSLADMMDFVNCNVPKVATGMSHSKEDFDVLVYLYTKELLIGEGAMPDGPNSSQLVHYILENQRGEFDAFFKPEEHRYAKKLWVKSQNLFAYLRAHFTNRSTLMCYNDQQQVCTLSMEAIKAVHSEVMLGLLPDEELGTFRISWVSPAGCTVTYVPPTQIPKKLQSLISDTTAYMTEVYRQHPSVERTQQAFIGATVFFRQFLLIHPFTNGNGRVARLLVSHLLRPFAVVPLSLYFGKRSLYIDLLDRCPIGSSMFELFMYTLHCATRQLSDLTYLFDTEAFEEPNQESGVGRNRPI
eukprot:m.76149 g.76149  ORF g.76149 m.76149 type:complete len:335 (+) comp12479_c0_seq1:64-1068(+)